MTGSTDNSSDKTHDLKGQESIEKIAELVKGIHICMMNTVAEDGSIDSRPMAVQNVPFEGTLWFLTRGSSDKVGEIQQDAHVTLTFAEPKDSKYVALQGKAAISKDSGNIHELWNEMYKAWFPKGVDDPEISVLRVDVSEGHYWEASSSKLVVYAKYLVAAVTGGAAQVSQSGHLGR